MGSWIVLKIVNFWSEGWLVDAAGVHRLYIYGGPLTPGWPPGVSFHPCTRMKRAVDRERIYVWATSRGVTICKKVCKLASNKRPMEKWSRLRSCRRTQPRDVVRHHIRVFHLTIFYRRFNVYLPGIVRCRKKDRTIAMACTRVSATHILYNDHS